MREGKNMGIIATLKKPTLERVIVPRGIRRQLGKNDVAVDDRLHGELLLPCRGLIN